MTLSKIRKSWLFYLAFAALWWYLTAFAIFPSLSTLGQSLEFQGTYSLKYFIDFFGTANVRRSLGNTLLLAFLTVFICGFVGSSLALAINAVAVPFQRMWHVLVLLPMVIPGTVVVISYVFLYGARSYIGTPLRELLQLSIEQLPFGGLSGILFIHAFTQYVYFYLLVSEAVERINTSQMEAAKTLGASPRRVFFDIVLPSFGPALTSATVLTFMGACASFSAPLIIGGNFRVISTSIFQNKQNGYINAAAAEAVLLFFLIILFIIAVRLFEFKVFRGHDIKGSGTPFQPIRSKGAVVSSILYLIPMALMILLPIAAVILISFGKYGTWTGIFHRQYTWDNYRFVFSSLRNLAPLINSTIASSFGTIGSMIIGVFAAYIITRTKVKGRILLETACLIPWLLPSAAILIALIAAYNVPNILLFNRVIVGTYWFMPLSFMIIRLPVIMRSASASLITLPRSLEEASGSLGATGFQTFVRIILPLMATGLSFSMIVSFITLMGDYGISVFAAVPSNIPITGIMMSNISYQRSEVAMVYGVCLIFIALTAVSLFSLFRNKGRL